MLKRQFPFSLYLINSTYIVGSGLHKADGPFSIVAMEKEVQADGMHQHRFGERERFANKTAKTLPKGIIPAFHMSCFTCLLSHCCVLLALRMTA